MDVKLAAMDVRAGGRAFIESSSCELLSDLRAASNDRVWATNCRASLLFPTDLNVRDQGLSSIEDAVKLSLGGRDPIVMIQPGQVRVDFSVVDSTAPTVTLVDEFVRGVSNLLDSTDVSVRFINFGGRVAGGTSADAADPFCA